MDKEKKEREKEKEKEKKNKEKEKREKVEREKKAKEEEKKNKEKEKEKEDKITKNQTISRSEDTHTQETKNTRNHISTNQSQSTQSSQNSTNQIRKVIIDNIQTTKPTREIIKILYNTNRHYISKIEPLNKGGLKITPESYAGMNALLKIDKYPKDIFGPNIYLHLADITDTRPWLCLNKVTYNQQEEKSTLENIKEQITETHIDTIGENIKIEGLHRKYTQLPTSLILFKTTDKIAQDKLLNTKIKINNEIHQIRLYIEKTQNQCTKCRKIGHLKKECKNKFVCPRCASQYCAPMNCQNNFKKCANCNGAHSATYKNCPILKQSTNNKFKEKISKTQNEQIREENRNILQTQMEQKQTIKTESNKMTQEINALREIVKNQETIINQTLKEIDIRDQKIQELIENFNKKTERINIITQIIEDSNKEINDNMKTINQKATKQEEYSETMRKQINLIITKMEYNDNISINAIYDNIDINTAETVENKNV